MSRTLTLIQTGWESIRATATSGRKTDALAQLDRLLARPDVPADILRDGSKLAAELALDGGRFVAARRHLKTVLALDASDARACYLTGRAWEEDPDGCDRRAMLAYRKATLLDGTNATFRAAFGRAAVRCGKVKCGAREMRAAADQTPGNIEVIRVVVRGLLEANRPSAARKVLERASFLNPGGAELTSLFGRVRFETARQAQRQAEKASEYTRHAQDAQFARDGDRVLLPFVRIAGGIGPKRDDVAVRTDVVSFPRPHFARLRSGKADG
ncbi:hypothetical protein GobsT_41430 [Gemmata obscuriglobus]|uniref:Tetratricopeptide repeat protein n=1 Tax=Gemmata obscuriglobus TaxID=114 RepID=A0A2Z3H288_9BACT|nr:hypothetical protein [Gemmata obscuriglobus]AWM37827.1 hypothetical protein C1280_13015 [Gemmata obscuriglobus]QEG29347.1 hypothetical protein GobsT_41430 [Gemmata obscuriglobus]VTS08367.1 hypothetical protein : [Gemmata obscuriglobus UQM 2246]